VGGHLLAAALGVNDRPALVVLRHPHVVLLLHAGLAERPASQAVQAPQELLVALVALLLNRLGQLLQRTRHAVLLLLQLAALHCMATAPDRSRPRRGVFSTKGWFTHL
ncbi:unnamed protein product, partial [Ixodes pacificus]